MANPIKYSTGSESLALKKGNFYIGTGDVGKGPSNTTGYYNGITPPTGGYTIYIYKSGQPGDLSYHTVSNDTELVSFTNNLAGTSYTTANECLTYFASQTDKVCFNRDYEGIVTDGLVFHLDAGFTPSYPKNGTTWYDISGNGNNGTLTNGPTFNSNDGGTISFDGSNDYVIIPNLTADFYNVGMWVLSNSDYDDGSVGGFIFCIDTGYVDGGLSLGSWTSAVENETYMFSTYDDTNNIDYNSTADGKGNVWYYFVANWESSKYQLYLNGNPITTTSQGTSTLLSGTQDVFIGGRVNRNNRYLSGKVGITHVYDRTLSSSEIMQNYNSTKGRFGL